MRRRRASPPWAGRNHYGGSRAAAADADVVVLTIEPGVGMVGRLRSALTQNPGAKRFVIRTRPESPSSSAAGEGAEFVKGFAAQPIGVIALPITDTCKEVVNGVVRRTVPRDTLVDARGPWFFARDALERALEAVTGGEEGISSAVALCRAAGLRVRVQLSE